MECCGVSAAGLESQMSKPSAPQPPDYVGAAQQTGQSNITAAIINRLMGMQGSNTPWGSLRWDQTGTTNLGPQGITTSAPAPANLHPSGAPGDGGLAGGLSLPGGGIPPGL